MAQNVNKQYASRDVCDLIFMDYATGNPYLYLDFANTTTTGLTGETVYAYGGHGHPKKVGFAGDRGGTITFETQIKTPKLLALITGGEISEDADLMRRYVITATEDGLALPDGESIEDGTAVTVFPEADDCVDGKEIASPSVSSNVVTGTDIKEGASYVVYYMRHMTSGVQRISIKSGKMPKEYRIQGYCTEKGEDGVEVAQRMVVYKAMPSPEVELSYSNNGDPQSLAVTLEVEADKAGDLIDYIYLDDDVED